MRNSYSKGFSLIELLVVLTLAAILAGIAIPSFSAIIQNSRLSTQYNELLTSLSLARSEAIKRGSVITVCKSSNGSTCTGNWQDGWIVFADINADGDFDAADGDEIIIVHDAFFSGNTLSFTGTQISYGSDALSIDSSSSTFTFCDNRGATNAKALIVNSVGRAGIAIDTDTPNDNIVNDHENNNVSCS